MDSLQAQSIYSRLLRRRREIRERRREKKKEEVRKGKKIQKIGCCEVM
jgi:hypothetical protein